MTLAQFFELIPARDPSPMIDAITSLAKDSDVEACFAESASHLVFQVDRAAGLEPMIAGSPLEPLWFES